ncbi:MAG: hypothetical protein NC124_17620 [Clostridium sp.]|nr:hypothetical protein [Clostridium sp.]
MLKYKIQTGIMMICVLALFVLQSIHSMATSLDNPEITEEMVEQDSDSSEQDDSVTNTQENSEEESTDISTENMLSPEQDTEAVMEDKPFTEEKEAQEKAGIQELDHTDTQTGKYYFFQKYLYDCNAEYLEDYVEYLELQVSAYEEMYHLGEITGSDLETCRAQKTLAQAELEIARNESAYYDLYLTKNGLDYSRAEIKEMKELKSMDYYIEQYPEKDYMTIARYVTDYHNATAGIDAKQAEVDALKVTVKMAEMLLQEGEISKLEYAQKRVSLAKAQYELEQKYVEMNIAYWRLTALCK